MKYSPAYGTRFGGATKPYALDSKTGEPIVLTLSGWQAQPETSRAREWYAANDR
jgi:hypothetical protein